MARLQTVDLALGPVLAFVVFVASFRNLFLVATLARRFVPIISLAVGAMSLASYARSTRGAYALGWVVLALCFSTASITGALFGGSSKVPLAVFLGTLASLPLYLGMGALGDPNTALYLPLIVAVGTMLFTRQVRPVKPTNPGTFDKQYPRATQADLDMVDNPEDPLNKDLKDDDNMTTKTTVDSDDDDSDEPEDLDDDLNDDDE